MLAHKPMRCRQSVLETAPIKRGNSRFNGLKPNQMGRAFGQRRFGKKRTNVAAQAAGARLSPARSSSESLEEEGPK